MPILDLCGPVSQFVAPIALPVGLEPFHYVATDIHEMFGPFDVRPECQLEAVLIDVTGGYVRDVSAEAEADTL